MKDEKKVLNETEENSADNPKEETLEDVSGGMWMVGGIRMKCEKCGTWGYRPGRCQNCGELI